jgi:DNA recombination protein RmuC
MVAISLVAFLTIVVIIALISSWLILQRMSRSIKEELTEITHRVNQHLEQSLSASQRSGEGAVKVMSDLYARLGSLEESNQKIYEVGKEIGKLQDVLKAPKTRGGFGELILGDVLAQMIPRDHFQLQYQFQNGTRVDAVIFVGSNLVPIDSKFPLENFQRIVSASGDDERKKYRKEFARDMRKHVDSISEKYISPEAGTFDFALMYVPAENVYYEVISSGESGDDGVSRYALDHHVIPVSPNSFYAYLQVILLGLRGMRVDEAARDIAESLTKMQSDFRKLVNDFGTLGTHLNHARGSYERVQRGVDQFEGKLAVVDQVKAITSEPEETAEQTK